MKKQTKLILIVFTIALLIRLIFLFSTPLKIWDETVYANLGHDLAKNPFDYSVRNNGWSDYIPSKGSDLYAWPRIGFKAPLLPYTLSIFSFLNINFLIPLFLPLIGALSAILVFLLGKKLFNEQVAFISAILFSLVPFHVYYSSKILTDAFVLFFLLLSILSFWEGYEKQSSKHKLLFGVFLALSLLARYTALWAFPVFLSYILIRKKFFIMKDKYFWYSILIFFAILSPWLVYGQIEYSSPIGPFIHGFIANTYPANTEPWYFICDNFMSMFSVVSLLFIYSLSILIYKKEILKKELLFLLIWIIFFILMASIMQHKEDRFFLPIAPAICILSALLIEKIQDYKKVVLIVTCILMLFSLKSTFQSEYYDSYNDQTACFLASLKEINKFPVNSVIVTDESTITYYYGEKATNFYPNPFSIEQLIYIAKQYPNKQPFILFTNYDMSLYKEYHQKIKSDLDKNFDKVFECNKTEGYSAIYKIA